MVKKHAALYVRVSTDAQREEGYSIEAQQEMLSSYCRARGLDWEFYTDGGFSGSNIDRPELRRLIGDVRAGTVSHVIVYKLDRLSRSQKDTLYLIEDVFGPASVSFVSLNENMDTETPIGRAMLGIMSAFAQLERETIRERTRMGMKERIRGGSWRGGGKTPFGYDYDRASGTLVPNSDAEKVRRLYSLYLSGCSLGEAARLLGLKYERLAEQILLRKTNIGVIVYRGEEYPGRHQPLIDRETYERAMEKYAHRRPGASPKPKHLLAGLLVCGVCGAGMRYQKWGKDGLKIYCYSQDSGKRHIAPGGPCSNVRYDAEEVEAAVAADIARLAKETFGGEGLPGEDARTAAASEIESPSELLKKRLAETRRRLGRLYRLFAASEDEENAKDAELEEAINELKAEEERYEKQLAEAIGAEKAGAAAEEERKQSLEALRTFGQAWELMTPEEKQRLLRALIDRVVLRSGRIDIFYR